MIQHPPALAGSYHGNATWQPDSYYGTCIGPMFPDAPRQTAFNVSPFARVRPGALSDLGSHKGTDFWYLGCAGDRILLPYHGRIVYFGWDHGGGNFVLVGFWSGQFVKPSGAWYIAGFYHLEAPWRGGYVDVPAGTEIGRIGDTGAYLSVKLDQNPLNDNDGHHLHLTLNRYPAKTLLDVTQYIGTRAEAARRDAVAELQQSAANISEAQRDLLQVEGHISNGGLWTPKVTTELASLREAMHRTHQHNSALRAEIARGGGS